MSHTLEWSNMNWSIGGPILARPLDVFWNLGILNAKSIVHSGVFWAQIGP